MMDRMEVFPAPLLPMSKTFCSKEPPTISECRRGRGAWLIWRGVLFAAATAVVVSSAAAAAAAAASATEACGGGLVAQRTAGLSYAAQRIE
eukprot:6207724-Pleurochrysis_carterae.AAC.1